MLLRGRLLPILAFPRQAWILAGVILLVTLCTGSTVTPILPDMKAHFGLTGTATALIVSLFSLARLAIDLPAGLLLDHVDHKVLLLAGALLVVLGSMLSALAVTFPILLLGQVMSGIGVNTCMIAAMVTFSRISTAESRGGLFGLYTSATLGSSSIGPIVSGILASALGWQATFIFASLAAAVAVLLSWLGVEARGKSTPGASTPGGLPGQSIPNSGFRASVTGSWAAAIYLIMFLLSLGSSGINHSALPIYAHDTLHLSAQAIGWAMGITMLFRSIISIIGGRLGDRYGHRPIVVFGLVTIGVGFLSLNSAVGFSGLFAAMLLISLGHMSTALPNAWLVSMLPDSRWGASLGIGRFWSDLAHVIGPVAILYIFDLWGFSVTTLVGACLMWLAAMVALAIVKRA